MQTYYKKYLFVTFSSINKLVLYALINKIFY